MRRFIREIHRRSVWQVLGIYLLGSWAGYEVVLALTEGVGLPSWVPPFAIVLFVIGLPIVVATAIVQEGHPLQSDRGPDVPGRRAGVAGLETAADAVTQREGATPAASETAVDPAAGAAHEGRDTPSPAAGRPASRSGVSRVLTWNRAITAGVLAFALLGLAATGFLGMRTLGIGPAATLVSSGQLDERSMVVLADFEAPDEGTAEVVTEALRIALHESQVMNLADAGYLSDVLRRMERDPSAPFTEDVAREVAEREGLKAVITGEIRELGGRLVLSARVERPDGSVLAAFREDAESDAALLDAVDDLGTSIREEVGESLRSVRRSEPLAAVSTSSIEALRLYSRAEQMRSRTGDDLGAAEFFRRAVEADSSFAMAWRKLGISLNNAGASKREVREALRRAYELRDRLPEQERYLAEGSYYGTGMGEPREAARAYRAVLDLNPDNTTALNNLALVEAQLGDPEAAAELMRRAAEISPTALHYANLGSMRLAAGDAPAAESAAARARELAPEDLLPVLLTAGVAYAQGDYVTAERWADSMETRRGPPARVLPLGLRATIDAIHGQIRDARAHLAERRSRALRAGMGATALESALLRAMLPLYAAADTATALREVERLPGDSALAAATGPGILAIMAAQGLAVAGQADRAEELYRETIAEAPDRVMIPPAQHAFMRATLARLRGRHDEALELLREAESEGLDLMLVAMERAAIHEALHRPDSAIAAYESILEVRGPQRVIFDGLFLPLVLQRLAALHDDAGRDPEAARYYARFVELWEEADPELQPRVEAARSRLVALTEEGR